MSVAARRGAAGATSTVAVKKFESNCLSPKVRVKIKCFCALAKTTLLDFFVKRTDKI